MKLQDFKNLKAGDVVEWEGKYIVIKRMRNDKGFIAEKIAEDEDGYGCSISDEFCFNYELEKPKLKLIGKARYFIHNESLSREIRMFTSLQNERNWKEVFFKDGNFYENEV